MTAAEIARPAIRVGQMWQEIDPRFPNLPSKEVVGFAEDGRVLIRQPGLLCKTTKAKPERFNGKRGGYRLVQESPDAP